MSELLTLNISQVLEGLKKKKFSVVELTRSYLDRIEETKALNMYLEISADKAITMAEKADENYKNNSARLLEGIPIGIKDMFCTESIKTTASSKILENFVPTYESTVSNKLWEEGAINLGKLSCDEFAMGSSNETAAQGNVINPWKVEETRSPGGSSGGSAAAVASKSALCTIGTDTGGSIRQPAAFCGIVGMKPTYGRCSRWGIIAFASSLDQAGPLTRNVSDSATMLKVMAGHDPKDSTSSLESVPNFNDF
jgi:Asp-tRNAAsn/Glu-tRNAGln amidotransferase A subunit and related amidases